MAELLKWTWRSARARYMDKSLDRTDVTIEDVVREVKQLEKRYKKSETAETLFRLEVMQWRLAFMKAHPQG
jgi:hypothetical protein